jgi:hypothetical protein
MGADKTTNMGADRSTNMGAPGLAFETWDTANLNPDFAAG